ncbi:hypothetical protein G6F37_012018 [Rhizopus arrhizus]|nr:hypothetical protein G6F37_012018 [Rhizopus arrhizus]
MNEIIKLPPKEKWRNRVGSTFCISHIVFNVSQSKEKRMLPKTKSGKVALKRFYEVADDFKNSGIKKSAKAILKSSMMQEVAHEEDERVQKKLKISVATSSNDDRSVMSGSDVEEDEIESRKNIWQDWKEFLNNAQNNKYLPSLSPEKHGVIWYGIDLRRRSSLPEDLYTRMRYETTAIKQYNISNSYKETIKNIIQSTNRNHMLESIKVVVFTSLNTYYSYEITQILYKK